MSFKKSFKTAPYCDFQILILKKFIRMFILKAIKQQQYLEIQMF